MAMPIKIRPTNKAQIELITVKTYPVNISILQHKIMFHFPNLIKEAADSAPIIAPPL